MALELAPGIEVSSDPELNARMAGLRYVSDAKPGITRIQEGDGFAYTNVRGERVTDPETLERIDSLRVPPAWTNVWICPLAHGHLQATGRDAKGRKQYLYHQRWREVRDASKFGRMLAFGQALPEIRRRVAADLEKPRLPREKVLAAVVRLLETTLIRVGNEEYARTNESYGLTTLREEHVDVTGSCLHFQFRGKRGRFHSVGFCDRRLARIVKHCQDLPGQELFTYLDENGEPRTISSEDVNDYLREVAGEEFTAKDFRTWAATVLVAVALREAEAALTKARIKASISQAIKRTAERLGNTPAICRKSYVNPAVLEAYAEGTLADAFLSAIGEETGVDGLDNDEAAVLRFLRSRIGAGGGN